MRTMEITHFPALEYACEEAMNTLATNLSYCGTDVKAVLITSRYAVEGKSFISMNLMRTIAGLKKRVVLVDTDLRRSGVQALYGLRFPTEDKSGLVHYLAGMCSIEETLYATNIPNAFMVPVGRDVSNSLQLLNSPRLPVLLDELKRNFDVVIVDSSPIGIIVDAAAVAKYCDGALLVVSYNRGRNQEVATATEAIEHTGCKVLGAVLNNVEFGSLSNRRYYYRSERYASYYKKGYAAYGYAPVSADKKSRSKDRRA